MRIEGKTGVALLLALALAASARAVPPEAAAPDTPFLPEGAVEFPLTAADLAAGPEVSVRLPGGRVVRFRTESEPAGPGLTGWRGWSEGSDRLTLFVDGGRVAGGDIHATGGRYRLVEHGGRHYWVDLASLPAEQPFFEPEATRPDLPAPKAAPAARPNAAGHYQVDVLVLYTGRLRSSLGLSHRGARTWAARQIFQANTYFANSFIPVRYRLAAAVAYTPVPAYEDPHAMADDANVRAVRDRTGSDLAILVDGGGCRGISAGFNSWHHDFGDNPPQYVNAERDAFAVAVTEPGCLPTLFAHELGHNLAAGHDIAFSFGLNSYWKSYAHGWHCGDAGNGSYYSVMHYAYWGTLGGANGDFFSNPALELDGEACGSVGVRGTEVTEADNARVIAAAAPYVAAYRTGRKDAGEGELAFAGAPGAPALLWLAAAALFSALRSRKSPGRR